MHDLLIFPAGVTDSCRYASEYLKRYGFPLIDHPSPDITHVLLDIPSFDDNGNLKDGSNPNTLLRSLPERACIIGGNLKSSIPSEYHKIDLLTDPDFLVRNAAITAECALRVAMPYIPTTFSDSPTLLLGWGRIGKLLANMLSSLRCSVTVAARNEQDRAMLKALGYESVTFSEVPSILHRYKIIFNTVPAQSICNEILELHKDIIVIDLASAPGLNCNHAINARGLPGKYAPRSAGKLIAETIKRFLKEVPA